MTIIGIFPNTRILIAINFTKSFHNSINNLCDDNRCWYEDVVWLQTSHLSFARQSKLSNHSTNGRQKLQLFERQIDEEMFECVLCQRVIFSEKFSQSIDRKRLNECEYSSTDCLIELPLLIQSHMTSMNESAQFFTSINTFIIQL
jgi:hypothetical protein